MASPFPLAAARVATLRVVLAAAFCLALVPAEEAGATLVGDTIGGALEFDGLSGNWFDPSTWPAPPGSSGSQPSAIVNDPDPSFVELMFSDGTCALCLTNLDVDVDASAIHLRWYLIDPASPTSGGLRGFDVWLDDLDWSDGQSLSGVDIAATSFTGFSASVGPDSIHLHYDGGQDLSTGAPELFATLSILTIPEPSIPILLGLGLGGLALRARCRHS